MGDIVILLIAYSPLILLITAITLALGSYFSSRWSMRAPSHSAVHNGFRTAVSMAAALVIVLSVLAFVVLCYVLYHELHPPRAQLIPEYVPYQPL
ncbi:MAG TPA: hypothetical protein VFL98_03960 [Candidatus Paceibacterota bacterium]|nr:hypothetical protein [Candidatus Paceibacterota bacterium]